MRIEFTDTLGVEKQCAFESFQIGIEAEKYDLRIAGYSEVAGMEPGDSLSVLNGNAFSARDQDNDPTPTRNTAEDLKGGGWYVEDVLRLQERLGYKLTFLFRHGIRPSVHMFGRNLNTSLVPPGEYGIFWKSHLGTQVSVRSFKVLMRPKKVYNTGNSVF